MYAFITNTQHARNKETQISNIHYFYSIINTKLEASITANDFKINTVTKKISLTSKGFPSTFDLSTEKNSLLTSKENSIKTNKRKKKMYAKW